MANLKKLPESFPPMGAEFKKPYMEFEFEGVTYKLEELKGGHNGKAAKACQAEGATWDEARQKWIVKVDNNLIDIELKNQPTATVNIPDSKSFLREIDIKSSPRRSKRSIGYLIVKDSHKDAAPTFPVDCEFYMHIQVKVPGKPSLTNPKPFKLVAKDLEDWPPPIDTVYTHDDTVELYPEWVPFADKLMKPVVKILPGDETIITEVFEIKDNTIEKPSMLSRIFYWLT